MANEDYKSDKIIEIVREFDNTGNKYEVNGMDIAHATPLWRTGNGKFQVIPKGSYRYITEESNEYFEIQDETILSSASEFQIIYIYEQESSEYIEDFPSLDILVSKYNQLVKDVTKVFSNLKNIGVKSDTLKMTKTLTELVPFTVWYLNADEELEALPISEMYDKFDQMVNKAYEDVKKLLLVDKDNMSVELREETDLLLEELRTLKNKLAEELEKYKDNLKKEINIHTNSKKEEINDYTTAKELEIGQLVEGEKVELTSHTDIKKTELTTYTTAKKGELDTYNTDKKKELNTHTSSKKEEINDYTTAKELEIGQLVEGEKVELTSHTDIKKTELDKYIVDNRATLKGEQGIQGIQGIQGPKGDKGEKGDIGPAGLQGIQGEQGKQGIQGVQGEQGIKGDKGDKGDTGSNGVLVEAKGMYGFQVRDGHLFLVPTGEETPNFKIENGHLILIL